MADPNLQSPSTSAGAISPPRNLPTSPSLVGQAPNSDSNWNYDLNDTGFDFLHDTGEYLYLIDSGFQTTAHESQTVDLVPNSDRTHEPEQGVHTTVSFDSYQDHVKVDISCRLRSK